MLDLLRRDRLTPSLDSGPRLAARVVAGIVLAAALGAVAFGLLFVGAVTFTGCFISCGEPEPVGGAALLAGAAVAAGGGLAALWWAVADRSWPVAWRVIGVLVAVAAVALPLALARG